MVPESRLVVLCQDPLGRPVCRSLQSGIDTLKSSSMLTLGCAEDCFNTRIEIEV